MSGGVGRLASYAGGGFAVARAGQQAASMDTLVRRLSRESDRSLENLTGLRGRAYEIGADRGVHASELMQAVVAAQGAGGVRIERDDLESLAVIMQRAGISGGGGRQYLGTDRHATRRDTRERRHAGDAGGRRRAAIPGHDRPDHPDGRLGA